MCVSLRLSSALYAFDTIRDREVERERVENAPTASGGSQEEEEETRIWH